MKRLWSPEEIKEIAGGGVENPLVVKDGNNMATMTATKENAGIGASNIEGYNCALLATASLAQLLLTTGSSPNDNPGLIISAGATGALVGVSFSLSTPNEEKGMFFSANNDGTGNSDKFEIKTENGNFRVTDEGETTLEFLPRTGLNLIKFSPKGNTVQILAANGKGFRITVNNTSGLVEIYASGGIKIGTNPRQPSIEYTGNITEEAGSGTSIGTYTLKYIPMLDSDGNVVGGAGTIALDFTTSSSASTLYLANSDTLPNLTGVVKAATGAMSMIHVKGASGNASELTLSGGIAGTIVATTLEGGVNIYSN